MNFVRNVRKYGVGLALAAPAVSVMAAVPTEVDTALTAVQTDMLALIGKGFAIVGAIGALWLVLGGFKKIINKSGS